VLSQGFFMKQLFILSVSFFWIGSCTHLAAQKLEIDLRTDTSNKKYFVGLAIRNDSFTGHAFVILYQQDQHDTEKKDFKVYGYYPKRIANIPIPIGVVKNDTNCLNHIPPNGDIYFIVDEAAFYEAKTVVDRWTADPPTFTLLLNCIDMLDEVAMSIGVNLPSRYNTIPSLVPEYYMKYLYKKLSSPKGIVYNKKYRLKLIASPDSAELTAKKPIKVIGQYIPENQNSKWILQTLK
jgi:hypothetical protein